MRGRLILAVIFISAGVLSLFASSYPDGLEYVAERLGFLKSAQDSLIQIIPDYSMPGIAYPTLAAAIAGIFGAGLTLLLSYLFGRVLFNSVLNHER